MNKETNYIIKPELVGGLYLDERLQNLGGSSFELGSQTMSFP